MNKIKWTHRITTGLISFMLAAGALRYLFQYDMVVEAFTKLQYPIYLIIPMAIA